MNNSVKELWEVFSKKLIITPNIEKSLDKIYQALDEIRSVEHFENSHKSYEKNYYKKHFPNKQIKSLYYALECFDKEVIKIICKEKIKWWEDADKFYYILQNINWTIKENKFEKFQKMNLTIPDILDKFWIEYKNNRCKCFICDSNNPTTFSFNDEVFFCFLCNAKGNTYHLFNKLWWFL